MDVIYPKELEIKDTTDSPKWANYLEFDHLEFDEDGTLFTRLYDKRADFDFPIHVVNFHSNAVTFQNPLHMYFIVSQLIRHAPVCSKYEDFRFRGYILVSNLLKEGYSSRKLHTMLNGLFTNCDI